jgi:hypothetical protein
MKLDACIVRACTFVAVAAYCALSFGSPPPLGGAQAAQESASKPASASAVDAHTGQERPEDAAAPAAAVGVRRAVSEGVKWLVDNQNPDGSWGSHESPRPIEVLADVPGSHEAFRVATTALCVIALEDCLSLRATSAIELDRGAEKALERGLDHLLAHFDVKRANGMEHYNVWSFGYTLQCFGERLAAFPEEPRAAAMRAACKRLVEKLVQYQTLDGGWGYLSLNGVPTFQPSDTSMSFTTATILVGLARARSVGVELPPTLVARALDEVSRARLPDGAYVYGDYLKYRPRMGVNENQGSACRTPACDYALGVFGKARSREEIQRELEQLLIKNARYQKIALRRPIPHESWFQVSGYFYLYGHAYAAYQLATLPESDQARLWPALVDAVMYTRQPDGSFWDYPLYSYHKPYGTAFALIALSRVPELRAAKIDAPR